tara:strand:+ start:301 stop:471 length:171 start_codon:yes stop_codon:yes gene_type:complete
MKLLKILSKTLLLSYALSQYDYSLENLNSTSPNFGNDVGTSYYAGHVTLHYFGHFT